MTGPRPLWSHQIELEAAPRSASVTRAFISRCLVEHDLPYLLDPVRLVGSELATNALVHAGTSFTVTLSQPDGHVLLAVRDGSASFPVHGHADVLDTSGRGLGIVDVVSLDWGMRLDGAGFKSVWASFALRADGAV